MRLQLILLAVVATTSAHADPDVTGAARVAVYHDSDATTVTTSSTAAAGDVAGGVRLDAQYLVDAVSSASVDVVSSATARIHDTRHEISAGMTTPWVRASYIHSAEHDWDSHTFGLAGSHDFLRHNLTLGASASYARNWIRRDGYPMFGERHLTSGGGEVFASYTLSPRDLVAAGVGVTYLDGYQASPYRFVVYGNLRAVDEVVPRTRVRQTLALRWNHALFSDTALRTHVRVYRDSWGVLALTGGAEYIVGVGALDLGAHARGHVQRHADFYRETYATAQTYLTSDRELGTLADVFVGVTASYALDVATRTLRLELAADTFRFAFYDFAPLSFRTGVLVGGGVVLDL